VIGLLSRLASPEGGFDEIVSGGLWRAAFAARMEQHAGAAVWRAARMVQHAAKQSPCMHIMRAPHGMQHSKAAKHGSMQQQHTPHKSHPPTRPAAAHRQAYPEFCRTVYDTATPKYFDAVEQLEKAYGKVRRRPHAARMLRGGRVCV